MSDGVGCGCGCGCGSGSAHGHGHGYGCGCGQCAGNRKIKIKLVYGDTTLNQTIGIVKTIGARNSVTVTPITWNNR